MAVKGTQMRTDIHRPSVIKPEEYEFVAFDYIKIGESGNILADCAYLQEQRRTKAEHMARTGGKYSTHEHGGNCMVCGSVNAIYTATFYHQPSNSYVRVGSDCTDKMYAAGEAGIEVGFNLFRRNIQNALEAQAGKKKAAAILEQAGLTAAWEIYIAEYDTLPGIERKLADDQCRGCGYIVATVGNPDMLCSDCRASNIQPRIWKDIYREELTIRDIVGKLVKYGSISDNATDYLGKLLTRIADRPTLEQKKAEERSAAADCPTGRVQITGIVLALKTQDGFRGSETKILVQADSGFKVWGSRFACVDKGDRVTFTATVTPSKDDTKFGFFKRPSKASIIWPEGADNDLITCPTCEGNSTGCGMCGGRHKVTKGDARRAGLSTEYSASVLTGMGTV